MTTTLNDACDYIISRIRQAGGELNLLKLQKLLYYVQAWHLAFYGRALFPGRFQAWVHGPVSREVYDRFRATKMLYSIVSDADITPGFDERRIPDADRHHINTILETYAPYSAIQLEEMTHLEEPWIKARGNTAPSERCETLIDEQTMATYYASRLKQQ